MWVNVVWVVTMGCQITAPPEPICDDFCLSQEALALFPTDYDSALASLQAIEDPLVRTATIMEVIRMPGLVLHVPRQSNPVCKAAGTPIAVHQCRERFTRQHLNEFISAPANNDTPTQR